MTLKHLEPYVASKMQLIYECPNVITTQMTESAAGINIIMEQSAIGVTDIAEKTSEVVNMSNETNLMAERSMDSARTLKEIVEKFKLDKE